MLACAGFVALLVIFVVLWDGFATIVLPHRVAQPIGLTRWFYRATWAPWSAAARRISSTGRRETFLSFYGPLSLIMLLGVWALDLIIAFGVLQWSLGSELRAPEGSAGFWGGLYMSGVTFFTLGFGDVIPIEPIGRFIAVAEAGTGFAFLAVVIGYLPVLYTAFSQREVNVSLLDARAGSPPTAAALLERYCGSEDLSMVGEFLRDWEQWCASLLESHLSYPVLGYYRSQHDNQSWVAALTMVMDTCALVMAGIDEKSSTRTAIRQARLTFAVARHAAVDLSQMFNTPPRPLEEDRLDPQDLDSLRGALAASGVVMRSGPDFEQQLTELRGIYEPYAHALSHHLLMAMPPWFPMEGTHDAWESTAWEPRSRVRPF